MASDYPTLDKNVVIGTTTYQQHINSESITAIQHDNCRDWWILSIAEAQDPSPNAPAPATLCVVRVWKVSSSAAGSTTITHHQDAAIGYSVRSAGYLRASRDGRKLVKADFSSGVLALFAFNPATGVADPRLDLLAGRGLDRLYGAEFSPDGEVVYFSRVSNSSTPGEVYGLDIAGQESATPPPLPSPVLMRSRTRTDDWYEMGALQLGPDDRIYVARGVTQGTGHAYLDVIDDPNTLDPSDYKDDEISLTTGTSMIGLPNLTPNACKPCCETALDEINKFLSDDEQRKVNAMTTCGATTSARPDPSCGAPLLLTEASPTIHVTFGDSACDCLESDDTEVALVTICNPHPNVALTDVTIPSLTVVQSDGSPVPTLPSGSASVEVLPIGPFCFGDIEPCSCVSRQFVLRNRGADPTLKYEIRMSEICYTLSYCRSTSACFQFEICEDD